MRIVQLVETLELGGLERMAVDLALSQHSAGHQLSVHCLLGAGALRSELDAAGIPVTEFHKERHSNLALVRSMARQLRRDRPDVIHGHNPGVHHFAAAAKWLAGVPACVNTRHSPATSMGIPYQERYFRWVKPWTDHVVFVCDYVRQHLEPQLGYPPGKCSVIRNGIWQERFLNRPASPGAVRPRIRFGTVGRLVPAKGHSVLIDAFASLAPRLPEAELRIFGDGPLEPQLRAQVQHLGMENRIRLEGRTEDASQVFESLDVFVFSSLNEGLPLVILEAMTAGLPIVSTRVGGVPEVVPDPQAGWLCEPGNARELARVMLSAAGSDHLEAIGREARRLAVENYGIDRMSRSYEALYRSLPGSR